MEKWTCEVVSGSDGKYRANLVVNKGGIEGLTECVNYTTLRKAI